MAKNVVKGTSIAVAASQTESPVSNPVNLQDRLNISAHVVLSDVTEANAITFQLEDSYDGGQTYEPVGSESQVAVTVKTASLGVAEKNTVTAPAGAAAAQGDYFIHHTIARSIAVWLDIDAAGTVPNGTAFEDTDEQIEVDITAANTADEVATAIRAALAGEADLTITGATDKVIIENVATGAASNVSRSNEAEDNTGSFVVATTTAGSDGAVALATDAITITTHGFVNNQRLIVKSTVAMPAPAVAGTFYVYYVDANTIKLRETFDGEAVDLTTFGSGTLSAYPATYHIRMIAEDSSDKAQLPFEDLVRVTCTTGASDSCTVSAVWIAEQA